ncbi:hypothetical protein I2I11_04110 [Pontibacter sp. 172403-2]|nr:hypothetical protein [Pontibacter sp. 172403-2]
MDQSEKEAVVKVAVEESSKILYITMQLCEIKNHISSTVELGGVLYELTFKKA